MTDGAPGPAIRIAVLPMYDLAELRPATDAFWTAVATRLHDRGITAPDTLTRTTALHESWTDPALLLGQTCGYPLVTTLKGRVTLVATPRYTAPGCDGALYRSAVVVRARSVARVLADMRGHRCAVNDVQSNSGMNLLRAEIAPLARGAARFFSDVVITGSHAASVCAVADGRADLAAIDCVTWAHLQRLRPEQTRGLRVLAWTGATPGLPMITSVLTDEKKLRILQAVLQDVASDRALASVRRSLLLEGFEKLPRDAYDIVLSLEKQASHCATSL